MLSYYRHRKRWKVLYDSHFDGLWNWVQQMTRDADLTDDIVQESFIRLFDVLKKKDVDNVAHYLFRIARNRVTDHMRRRRPTESFDATMHGGVEAPEDFGLEPLLAGLSTQQQVSIRMYYYEGYPVKDIALTLKVSENTVKTHLMRGRQQLKQMINEDR